MVKFHKKHVTLETIISEFIECRASLKKAYEEIEALKKSLAESQWITERYRDEYR